MKMKIVAVKYADWVLLAALGALMVFSLVRNFLIQDRTLSDLSEEIRKYDSTVQTRMNSDEVTVEPPTDFLGELRDRFEHMPVISPYRRDPFVAPEDIELNMVQIVKENKKEILIKGARVTENLTPTSIAEIKLNYKPEEGDTVVEIVALAPGKALIRLRDDTEQTYRFELNVLDKKELPPPYAPMDVTFATRPPTRKGALLREPPIVLVAFYPVVPLPADTEHGPTIGAWVERKLADDPDVEYVRVNQTPLRKITKREDAAAMWRRFQPEEEAPVQPVGGGAGRPAIGGALIPEEAPMMPAPGYGENAAQAAPLISMGQFAFLDTTVDEGESYIYRIVTINEGEDIEPEPCEEPFVSPTPINVPALVEFTVVSTSLDGSAVFNITAPSPEDGMPVTQRFSVKPGMPIGGKFRVRVGAGAAGGGAAGGGLGGPGGGLGGGGVAIPAAGMVQDVDFSTGCILVGALPAYKELEYRITTRGNQINYQVRPAAGGQVLYLTPRGVLRWKGKERTAAQNAPGMGGMPGMPGMGAPGVR